jgi:hypothetical protein
VFPPPVIFTDGFGRTVMVKFKGVPEQPFKVGVTDKLAVIELNVLFTALKTGMAPVPLAPSPMVELLLVQLNVDPPSEDEKFTAEVDTPAQTEILPTELTEGTGFTVTVCWADVTPHVFVTSSAMV